MNISKGRYWDEGVELVSGCTPVSPGCEHCWSAAMDKRFNKFTGEIICHPDRLSRFTRRKPTVFAIWNDLFHEAVPFEFIGRVWIAMNNARRHIYIVLTKRPQRMLIPKRDEKTDLFFGVPNVHLGLTVCNQEEADAKIPPFLDVHGKKFLSVEPLLAHIDVSNYLTQLGAVILGAETGPGARPMHPDWARSLRDQCLAAGVPFFFKQNGEWLHESQFGDEQPLDFLSKRKAGYHVWPDNTRSYRVTRSRAGRLLDGRTHDNLPWRQE